MDARPSRSAMQENMGSGEQNNASRCSGHFVHWTARERYNNEHLQATAMRSGGSLRVWSRISANSVGNLFRINDVLNAEKYRQMLIHCVIPSGRCLIGPQIYPAAGQWTLFSIKKNRKSWKCQHGHPWPLISTSSSVSRITWRDRRIWGSQHPQKIWG